MLRSRGKGIGQKLLSNLKADIVPLSLLRIGIRKNQKVTICYTDALEAKRTNLRRYDKSIVCGER